MTFKTFAAVGLTLAGLLLAPAAARAQSDETVRRMTVSYSDINLSSRGGAKVLMRRLRSAAEAVCDDGGVWQTDLAMYAQTRRCMTEAMRDAVDAVNRPELTALAPAAPRQKAIALAQTR